MALALLNEFGQNPKSASRYLYFPLILPFKPSAKTSVFYFSQFNNDEQMGTRGNHVGSRGAHSKSVGK